MKRWIAWFLALIMVFGMTACASKAEPTPSLSNQLSKLPTEQNPEKQSEEAPEQEEPEQPKAEENKGQQKGESKEEPEEEPAADGPIDYTAYDGLYREKEPMDEGQNRYVVVRGFMDFLLLEYFVEFEGSTFSFWVEEFWPDESGIDGSKTVQGKSQEYSIMTVGDCYMDVPRSRTITLTDEGLVLQYEGFDEEVFVRDKDYGGYHSTEEELMKILQDMQPAEVLDSLVGSWEYWDGWRSIYLVMDEDGGFHYLSKAPGKPARVLDGVWGVNPESGRLHLVAEMAGEGLMPYIVTWDWWIEDGELHLVDEEEWLLEDMGNDYALWKTDGPPILYMDQTEAMGYVWDEYDLWGAYTDQYGTEYNYIYRLPQFMDGSGELDEINQAIRDRFAPVIEGELEAMEQNEFLSTEAVQYEIYRVEDIVILHVYTFSYMAEDHAAYYLDTRTNTPTDSRELLRRMDISEQEFLDAVRAKAEAYFIEAFSGLPEEDREANYYYEYLDWTVSDEAVNMDLPIFVDRMGTLCVYARIGSLAGASEFWAPVFPFDDFEAVG